MSEDAGFTVSNINFHQWNISTHLNCDVYDISCFFLHNSSGSCIFPQSHLSLTWCSSILCTVLFFLSLPSSPSPSLCPLASYPFPFPLPGDLCLPCLAVLSTVLSLWFHLGLGSPSAPCGWHLGLSGLWCLVPGGAGLRLSGWRRQCAALCNLFVESCTIWFCLSFCGG